MPCTANVLFSQLSNDEDEIWQASAIAWNTLVENNCVLPKVVRQQFIGEVCKYIIFQCQVSSGCYKPKIVKIGCLFTK